MCIFVQYLKLDLYKKEGNYIKSIIKEINLLERSTYQRNATSYTHNLLKEKYLK